MPNSTERVADDIRSLLQADDQRLTDEMQRLAGEYAEACRTANDRLRRCMDLIRQGLRTEAVHLAEADPPITDLVNELDLAELQPAWEELCSVYDLPRAEPLRLELAEAVNETYAELEPLNALLSRHRRLALARAPMSLRIATLRDLVDADAQTPFWEDDLRAYERARLREIEGEAREAAQARDTAALATLVDEVTSPSWRERPPSELQKKVKAYAKQIQRGSARDELAEIEPRLQDAFAALDVAQGRQLRERWNSAAERAKLAADDPLAERVEPILGWLSDEDAREEQDRSFRVAVADLENAVEHDEVDLAELERKAHVAARFERELPATLVAAYRNRRASLESGEKRRRFAIAGGAGVALLLVIGFVGLLVWRAGVDQKIEQLAAEVTGLIDAGKLTEARRLFDENRDISAKDLWLTTRRQLEDAERTETDRKAELTAALEAISASAKYSEAAPHLKAARAKAATPDEKLAVARLEREWQDRQNVEYATNEERFRTAAQAAAEVLTRLDKGMASSDMAQIRSLASNADVAVRSLLPLTSNIRPEVAREREVLAARLAALHAAITERGDREELLDDMTAAIASGETVGAVDQYVAAVEAFRDRFPKEPRSAEFAESLAEADLWRGAVRWSKLSNDWKAARPSDNELTGRLRQIEGYVAANAGSPTSDVAQEYAAFLNSLSQRTTDDGINSRLHELARAPLIGGPLHVLRATDGRAFYIPGAADFSGSLAATFEYIIGTDPSRDTKSTLVKKNDLVSVKSSPAPQMALAESILSELPKTAGPEWDRYLLKLSKAVLQGEGYDPFVQHLVLTELLSAAADGNAFLAAELQDLRSRLDEQDIDPAARWMDPGNTAAAASRQRAGAALRRVLRLDLDTAWQKAAEAEQRLDKVLKQTPQLIGWLTRGENTWRVSGVNPTRPTAVSIATPSSDGATWQSIGQIAPGKQTLTGPGLQQGRLVFAFRDVVNTNSASSSQASASR